MYAVGIGHDVPPEMLAPVRCRNGEVRPSERRYGDGGAADQGLYSAPVFDVFGSAEEYQDELEKWGLLEAETADVTWTTRDEMFAWHRYNGIAVRPELGSDGAWRDYFPRGFTIYVHSLTKLED